MREQAAPHSVGGRGMTTVGPAAHGRRSVCLAIAPLREEVAKYGGANGRPESSVEKIMTTLHPPLSELGGGPEFEAARTIQRCQRWWTRRSRPASFVTTTYACKAACGGLLAGGGKVVTIVLDADPIRPISKDPSKTSRSTSRSRSDRRSNHCHPRDQSRSPTRPRPSPFSCRGGVVKRRIDHW